MNNKTTLINHPAKEEIENYISEKIIQMREQLQHEQTKNELEIANAKLADAEEYIGRLEAKLTEIRTAIKEMNEKRNNFYFSFEKLK